MDPRNQAYIPSSQRGGHDQTFGGMGLASHGANANMASPTAQRVPWYSQGNATNNGVATLPATYPRQPGTSISFDSSQQNPKSTATLESNSPKEPPRITKSLSSSFFEHTRREGPAANSCMVCNASFQSNSGLESHAKSTGHLAYSCMCDTSFGRFSSLTRHVNSNTGSGYHCGLCEERTLPRIDKLYDHLRDGHKVSLKVLDRYRNKALGRVKTASRPIKPAPAPGATQQVPHVGGFDSTWVSPDQVNGMAGQYNMNMTPLSPNGVNPAHLTNYTNSFHFQ